MDTPNGQEALSCNRVFNIPELLALIVFHLNNDNDSDGNNNSDGSEKARSLRVLVNVCHLWHRLLAPYVWNEVTLPGPSTHKRLSGLLRYRTHIQTLTCNVVTKKTLNALTRPHNESTKTKTNCNNELTNLKTLHLTLDRASIWISYTHLETFFLRTSHNSSHLSTISIKFDSTVLDIRLLWSLSQLPFLEDLRLETVRYNHRALGLDDLCREILVCCTGLRSFRMESTYRYRDYIPRLVRWKVKVVGRVARKVGGWTPECVEDAVARRGQGGLLTTAKGREPSSSMAQRQQHELTSGDEPFILRVDKNNSNNNGHIVSNSTRSKSRSRSNLRKLQLWQCSFDTLVFSDVVKQTSQLEELDLQTLFYRGSSGIMGTITRHCRHLRKLRLSGRTDGMSIEAIAKLLLGLPRMEEFFLDINNSELLAWQSLDALLLAEHEQEQEYGGGHRHPLKTLSIKGYYKETLPTLLEIISLHSLSLSTLTIGSPWFFQIFMEHTPGNLYSPFAPLVERQTPSQDLFSRPWSAMKDSLVRLDISTTILVDREVAGKIFVRLQELKALKGLYVSARHVKDWFPKNFIVTLPPPLSPRQTDNNNSNGTGNSGSIGYRRLDRAYIMQHLPTGTHCFPCLQDMIIRGEDRNVPVPFEITTSEAVFLIAAMPCLEYLYLKQGSVGEKTLKSLKNAFPEYFEMIPKKRVDWIDERDS
ncbi:hypothetical protein EC957_011230 [Mortierella hygrophila]|uniref:F-box domain-containing protein n=1 Tax=Mortierella hygrophila TaxID=979708 RepID=A0A9P6F9H0_9FUNG|nr:hypothetical protein EC957_011230 [Mortierella hygrophila]